MDHLQDVDAEPRRPEAPPFDAMAHAIEIELNLRLWDVRLAAVLNTLEIARAHGAHEDWTSEHAAQIRAMMAIADQAVAGEGGVVPQGFGAPVRTQMAAVVAKARAQAARPAGDEA